MEEMWRDIKKYKKATRKTITQRDQAITQRNEAVVQLQNI